MSQCTALSRQPGTGWWIGPAIVATAARCPADRFPPLTQPRTSLNSPPSSHLVDTDKRGISSSLASSFILAFPRFPRNTKHDNGTIIIDCKRHEAEPGAVLHGTINSRFSHVSVTVSARSRSVLARLTQRTTTDWYLTHRTLVTFVKPSFNVATACANMFPSLHESGASATLQIPIICAGSVNER